MAPKGKAEASGKAAAAPKKAKAEKKDEEQEGPKMDPPDRKEFDEETQKIQDKIDALQKDQSALATKIGERSGGKQEFIDAKKTYRSQLDEFSLKIEALMQRKGDFQKAMGEKRQERSDMHGQLNKMKRSIGYTSESQIDERIATIEFQMVSTSLTLKEEKEFLREISELKKQRPNIRQLIKMEDNLKTRDTGVDLKANIGQINEEINLYRDGKRLASQKLAELQENHQEVLGEYSKLIEQRQEIAKKIKEQSDIRTQLREDFRQKEREYNQWRNEDRRKKQDKILEERAAKQAEGERYRRSKEAEKLDHQPHVQEMTLIEQTIFFCQKLVATKEVKVEEKKEIVHNNPEGTEILLPDRDEEYLLPPTGGKKKKGKANKAQKESAAKPIKHNAETFKLFDQLKLNAPITTDDIPATLEKLEEQLAHYKEKVSIWERDKDEKKAKILSGEYVKDEPAKEEAAAPAEEAEEEKKDE